MEADEIPLDQLQQTGCAVKGKQPDVSRFRKLPALRLLHCMESLPLNVKQKKDCVHRDAQG
eukprot:8030943-Prorocentrum_lima.AAC.1